MRWKPVLVAGAALGGAALIAQRRRVAEGVIEAIEGGERTKIETSDGAVLEVHIAGEGPTVVLPHCWGGSMETWAPVAFRLVDRGHRVVRYNHRGHGGSTAGDEGFTIARLGADLRDVLIELDVRDAVIAAHSLGGMATQAFAIDHPDVLSERVRALVLVATASAGIGGNPIARHGHRVLGLPGVDWLLRSRNGAQFVRGALGKGATRAAVSATRDLFVDTPSDVRLALLEAMVTMDLREGLERIRVPTTVVSGTRDTLTRPRLTKNIADAIPGARFVSVPGGGHMLPYEAPDLIVKLIEEACASAAAAPERVLPGHRAS